MGNSSIEIKEGVKVEEPLKVIAKVKTVTVYTRKGKTVMTLDEYKRIGKK